MIAYIKGTLIERLADSIVIDTGGFGMEVYVPSVLMDKLPRNGEEVKLHTYFKISEDAMSLYGFNDKEELELFKSLLSVSGIGARIALAIMSTFKTIELKQAIVTEDIKFISKAPGVGAKMAKRMVLELKDKITSLELVSHDIGLGIMDTKSNADIDEAKLALVALGYKEYDALNAIKQVEGYEQMAASDLLKQALKRLI